MQVVTNNQPRQTLIWQDLTAREQREFDYLDTTERQETADFFRYRGVVYDQAAFMPAPADLAPWQFYCADSYFSGVVVRWAPEGSDDVIVGTYFA